jgi:hypothetical protein
VETPSPPMPPPVEPQGTRCRRRRLMIFFCFSGEWRGGRDWAGGTPISGQMKASSHSGSWWVIRLGDFTSLYLLLGFLVEMVFRLSDIS